MCAGKAAMLGRSKEEGAPPPPILGEGLASCPAQLGAWQGQHRPGPLPGGGGVDSPEEGRSRSEGRGGNPGALEGRLRDTAEGMGEWARERGKGGRRGTAGAGRAGPQVRRPARSPPPSGWLGACVGVTPGVSAVPGRRRPRPP